MDVPSPSKATNTPSLARVTRQTQWKQSPSRNSAISFSPSPAKQIHRAWERRPVLGTSRNGKHRKIWKRFQKQELEGSNIPEEDEEIESRSPVKIVKRVCIGKEITKNTRTGKRQGLVATRDRRKSGLPHKLPQLAEDLEADCGVEQRLSDAAVTDGVSHLAEFQNSDVSNAIDMAEMPTDFSQSELVDSFESDNIETRLQPVGEIEIAGDILEEEDNTDLTGQSQLSAHEISDLVEINFSPHCNEKEKVDSDPANPIVITLGSEVERTAAMEEEVESNVATKAIFPLETTSDNVLSKKDSLDTIKNLGSEESTVEYGDCLSSSPLQKASAQGEINVHYGHTDDANDSLRHEEGDSGVDHVGRPEEQFSVSVLEEPATVLPNESIETQKSQDRHPQARQRTAKGDTLIDIQIMAMPSSDDVEDSIEETVMLDEEHETDSIEDQDESIESVEDGDTIMDEMADDLGNDISPLGQTGAPEADTTLDIDLTQPVENPGQEQAISMERIHCHASAADASQVQSDETAERLDDTLDILIDLPNPPIRNPSPRRSPRKLHPESVNQVAGTLAPKSPAKQLSRDNKNCEDSSASAVREETTTVKVNLNDDDTILRDFLSRSRASKAAKIAKQSAESNKRDSDVVKHALASPVRVLEEKDTNSPASFKNRNEQPFSSPLATKPVKSPSKVDAVENNPELQDELAENLPFSIDRRTRTQPRRASKETFNHPNVITMRRSENVELLPLKRTEAQVLGTITRANTKKNKAGAVEPAVRLFVMRHSMLLDFSSAEFDEKYSAEGNKTVRWKEELVSYFDEGEKSLRGELDEEKPENGIELFGIIPKSEMRRARMLGAMNGTPSKPKKAAEIPESSHNLVHQMLSSQDSLPKQRVTRAMLRDQHKGWIPTLKRPKPMDEEERENKPKSTTASTTKTQTVGTSSIGAAGTRPTAMPRRGISARR